jgi:hypothetical protein
VSYPSGYSSVFYEAGSDTKFSYSGTSFRPRKLVLSEWKRILDLSANHVNGPSLPSDGHIVVLSGLGGVSWVRNPHSTNYSSNGFDGAGFEPPYGFPHSGFQVLSSDALPSKFAWRATSGEMTQSSTRLS